MIKNIFGTIITRFTNAIISFIIIILISRQYGAEGVGTIGLILLGITIIVLVNNFVGGSALVYLVPRYNLFKLIIPSYVWALFVAVPIALLLGVLNLIPSQFTYHVMILAFVFSLTSINQMFLLGKEKIGLYNLISLSQMLALLLCLLFLNHFFNHLGIYAYVYSLYVAYLLSFLWSFISVSKIIKFSKLDDLWQIIKTFFKFGLIFQLANLFQLFNYRLAYYLVDFYLNRACLGIYNLSTQISEGVWNIPKSLSTIIYSKISNSDDNNYSIKLTLSFLKLSLVLTLTLLIAILLIPKSLYAYIFGADFVNVKDVIFYLSFGIVLISCSMILSHYFSGIGKPHHNTIASGIGFGFTLILGVLLIPAYKLAGAAIATSFSYAASCIYQLIVFCKLTKVKANNFIFKKVDFILLRNEIKKYFRKKNNF